MADEEEIGLEDEGAVPVQDDVNRGIIDPTEIPLADIGAKQGVEIPGDHLVLPIRRGWHPKLPVDQLMGLDGLGQGAELCIG